MSFLFNHQTFVNEYWPVNWRRIRNCTLPSRVPHGYGRARMRTRICIWCASNRININEWTTRRLFLRNLPDSTWSQERVLHVRGSAYRIQYLAIPILTLFTCDLVGIFLPSPPTFKLLSDIRHKRPPKRLLRSPNDVYVNRATQFGQQLARCHRLLDER